MLAGPFTSPPLAGRAPVTDQAAPTARRTTPPDVVKAAEAELAATRATPRAKEIGAAVPVDGAPRRFRVANPTIDLGAQPAGELYLEGPASGRVPVDELVFASHEEIVVTVLREPQGGPVHLYRKFDASFVARAFVDYLSKSSPSGMTPSLLRQELATGNPVSHISFNDLQCAAVGAIAAPGLSVIWGPPGTGKTRVIGAAVERLAAAGPSIAIVSNTNVAVDEALLRAAQASEPLTPGVFVRVGHASTPKILEHPSLTIRKAAAARSKDLADRLAELDALVEENAQAETRTALAQLEEQVGTRDAEALTELISVQHRQAQRPLLFSQLEAARIEADGSEQAVSDSSRAYVAAREARKRLHPYDDLPGIVEQAALLQTQLQDDCSRRSELEGERAIVEGGRIRGRRKRIREIDAALSQVDLQITELESRLSPLDVRIDECAVAGITSADLSTAIAQEQVTHDDWREATSKRKEQSRRLAELTAALDEVDDLRTLDDDDRRLIELCEVHSSPAGLLSEVASLRETTTTLDLERQSFDKEISELNGRLQQLETTVVSEAKVVGTTLAQLVLHKGLVDREFDFVIIDEASAALPIHVFTALTKARIGASLIGDFEQNGPISNTSLEKTPGPLRRWLHKNPFELVGISNVTTAQSLTGCTALRDQYRFGPLTTHIANEVAYNGLLRIASWEPPYPPDDPEISLIDTSALEESARYEVGTKQKGRWWAAGAALSRHLAAHHGFANVGVVTPYRLQAQLTEAHLREVGGGATQVGTAHSFQGREFETVIFDLVEDGDGTSWVSSAHRNGSGWALDGVRLFNVAVTRNARRLYIIGNAGAVRTAQAGPLSILRPMLKNGLINIIDARELLGGPLDSDSEQPLSAGLVRMPAPILFDSHDFYSQLEMDLRAVRDRVVFISPFVGSGRLNQLRATLRELVQRGVDVRCVVTPGQQPQEIALRESLRATGAKVKEIANFHEKVVILDRDVTYVGSLNALSNTPQTSELMMRFEGRESTRLIETWMRDALKK